MTAQTEAFGPSDAELVAGVLAADREAFAAVYDRYGAKLYDFAYSMLRQREDAADAVADSFVIVAEKLHQLREPDRLRPWLYAIVRSECLRLLRARKKVAYGDDERFEAMADDALTPDAVAEQVALQKIVWDAAAGLADRDRALLDLHLRQGLEGAELGEAMGVTANNAYVMVNRLRSQVDRSLGALLIGRMGRDDCDELDSVLADWDGTYSPLVRKRVARHIDDCDVCSVRRKKMVAPTALFGAVPPVLVPLSLRDRVVDDIELVAYTGGSSTGGGGSVVGKIKGMALAAGVFVAVTAITYAVWPSSEDPTTTAAVQPSPSTPSSLAPSTSPTPSAEPIGEPEETTAAPVAPGTIRVSTQAIDLGSSDSESVVTLSNPGGESVTAQVTSGEGWLSATPGSATVLAGGTSTVTVSADRGSVREGDSSGTITVSWAGGSIPIDVSLRTERVPNVGAPVIPSNPGCSVVVRATVTDESGLARVILRWTGPSGAGSAAMTASGRTYSAEMGPFFAAGQVTAFVEAIDRRGNATKGPSTTAQMNPCPG